MIAIRRKISLGLCLFLTIAPLLGVYITNEAIGQFVGNVMPYIGLTIPQIDGMPFADAIGALFALFIFLFGMVGFIIFTVAKFKNTDGLKAFLIMTIIYCGLRMLGGLFFNLLFSRHADIKTKIFIAVAVLSDAAWGGLSYWAARNL